jgi:Tol biopolymer transport system component
VFSVRESAEAGPAPAVNSLWQIATKDDTAEAVGKAERVAAWNDLGPLSPSISRDGKRLVFLKTNSWQDVYLAEVATDGTRMRPPRRYTLDNRGSHPSGWTADGQAILLGSERNGRGEIFKQSLRENVAEVLAQSPTDDCEGGVLSADGSWLLYRESRHAASNTPSAPSRLMRRPAGGGSSEMVFEEPAGLVWSYACPVKPDRSCILSRKEGTDLVFYQLDAVRGKGAELGRAKATDWNGWGVSPDGSRLALGTDKGRIEVLSIGDRTWREIAVEPGWERLQTVAWTSDGRSFYATCWLPDSFALIHVTQAGKVTSLLHYGHRQFLGYPLPSPNGKYLAFQAETWDSNVWLMENAGLERK